MVNMTSLKKCNEQNDCNVCSPGKYSIEAGRLTDCDKRCGAGTYLSDTINASKHNEEQDCIVCSAGKHSTATGRITDLIKVALPASTKLQHK